MDESLESVLAESKTGLERLQHALEQAQQSDFSSSFASKPAADFFHQVEELFGTLSNSLETFEFQIEQAQRHNAQQIQAEQRQSQNLLSELEAQIEAELQQVRLLRGDRDRRYQFQQEKQAVLEKKLESLLADLRTSEARIETLEAESLHNRTWAISLNVQRQVAQQTADQLRDVLEQKRLQLQTRTETLDSQDQSLDEQRTLAEAQTKLITDLRRDLATAHRTIEALEQQIVYRNRQQAGLLQARQETNLLQRKDQTRLETLETQNQAYQTQITEQTQEILQQQRSLQEWRQRSLAYQHQLQNIRDWLEHFPSANLPPELLEMILAPTPELFMTDPAPVDAVHASNSPQELPDAEALKPDLPTIVTIDSKLNRPADKNQVGKNQTDKDALDLPQFPQ